MSTRIFQGNFLESGSTMKNAVKSGKVKKGLTFNQAMKSKYGLFDRKGVLNKKQQTKTSPAK